MPHQSRRKSNRWSKSLSSFNYLDVLSVGIFLPHLVMNVHQASIHAIDVDLPAINVRGVGVDSRDGQLGGSVLASPLDNQFFNCLDHHS